MLNILKNHIIIISVLILAFILSACGPKYIPAPKTEKELLDSAITTFERLDTRRAREQFEELKFEYPGSINIAQIQFYIGMCSFLSKDYLSAEQEFRLIVRDFKKTETSYPSAYFYMLEAMFYQTSSAELDQEMTYTVLDEIERFLSIYPDHPEFSYLAKNMFFNLKERLAEKLYIAGYIYSRLTHFASAKKYFKMLEDEYPNSRWTIKGYYEWSNCALELEQFKIAKDKIDLCESKISTIKDRYKRDYNEPQKTDFIDKTIHLYGLIPFSNVSLMDEFVNTLNKDVKNLKKKIAKKKAQKANEKS